MFAAAAAAREQPERYHYTIVGLQLSLNGQMSSVQIIKFQDSVFRVYSCALGHLLVLQLLLAPFASLFERCMFYFCCK
jgi:hypothetical protein